jgi:TIR domain/Acetyltransferase (GNAT) family
MSTLLLSSMKRPIVYIAYSRTDSQWKDGLVAALRSLNTIVHTRTLDDIKLGQDWKAQLRRVLSDADVAILLISPAFLEPEFIASVEIPALLKRREREGLLIVSLVIESCRWEDISWLRTIQVRSLADDLTDLARDQALYSIAKQILGHVSDDEGAQVTGPATQSADPRLIFISHHHDDHEFARLLKKRLEKNKLKAWAVVVASDCVKVNQLFLLPEHQGKGIGRKCMLLIMEEVRQLRLPIRLRVLKVNPRALAFYQRLGFVRTGETGTHVLMEWAPNASS